MILDKIKEIIKDILDIEPEEVHLSSRLSEDFDADSLDKIQIVMAIEETFNIKVEDEDVKNINTIQDAINYIEKKSAN